MRKFNLQKISHKAEQNLIKKIYCYCVSLLCLPQQNTTILVAYTCYRRSYNVSNVFLFFWGFFLTDIWSFRWHMRKICLVFIHSSCLTAPQTCGHFLSDKSNELLFLLSSLVSENASENAFWIPPKGGSWLPGEPTMRLEGWRLQSHLLI